MLRALALWLVCAVAQAAPFVQVCVPASAADSCDYENLTLGQAFTVPVEVDPTRGCASTANRVCKTDTAGWPTSGDVSVRFRAKVTSTGQVSEWLAGSLPCATPEIHLAKGTGGLIAMAAPTFVQEAETAWNSATTPKGSGNFTTSTGDVVVAVSVSENNGAGLSQAGTNVTLSVNQTIAVGSYCETEVSSGVVGSGGTTSVSFATGSFWFGGNAITFTATDGIGASNKTNASGAPSLSLTTTQDNSAVVVVVGDWNAADGASRTWRTVNSITPTAANGYELSYFRDSSRYTAYVAYYPDVGAAGAKTVGLSAPTGTAYSIIALEVKGTAGAAASILRQMMAHHE